MPAELDPLMWRAAAWALRATRHTRRQLRTHGLGFAPLPAAPPLPERSRRAVTAVLRRSGSNCLERATVWQAWEVAHGRNRDVVVGVIPPRRGFRAHAWLDGDEACHEAAYAELLRIPPRTA